MSCLSTRSRAEDTGSSHPFGGVSVSSRQLAVSHEVLASQAESHPARLGRAQSRLRRPGRAWVAARSS